MLGDDHKNDDKDDKRTRNALARRGGPFAILVAVLLAASVTFLIKRGGHQLLASEDQLIDIDIGTLGKPMRSDASLLITFDPGDEPLKTPTLERYKVVIADRSGPLNFYVNPSVPGCSSLHRRNEDYNTTNHGIGMKKRCDSDRAAFERSGLYRCMHAPLRTERVQAMLLSTFIKRRGIRRIGMLKIDAQGSDFAILKDVIEHCPSVRFNSIVIECQVYRDVPPLYFADNDCDDAQAYMEEKFPGIESRRGSNNCMAHEFNMYFRKSFDRNEQRKEMLESVIPEAQKDDAVV